MKEKKIGLVKALKLVKAAEKLSEQEKLQLQKRRLNELIAYVKEKSPYLSQKYKDIGPDFKLSDIPYSNKVEMMEHFDEWTTDSKVKMNDVQNFMKNLNNMGRKYLGKYLVFTTSGSTGNPCVVLNDMTAYNVSAALGVSRSFARKEDMKAFIKGGGRSMGLFADNGFYLGNCSIHFNRRRMPWKRNKLAIFDVRNSQESIVDELNRFQPVMLGSYPNSLELLIPEQKAGRLHISPALIMGGGEGLRDDVRKELCDTFHCYVQTSYSCTEGGTMCCECTEQHYHINDDWIILEAVDENNQPVPFGTQSAKILLTNLSNYIQPIIRFEITDRVVIHDTQCSCGKKGKWLTVEGRTDDILTFEGGNRVAPLSLYALLKEVHEMKRFQLIQVEENVLALRMSAEDKEAAFHIAQKVLIDYLSSLGITVQIKLDLEEPKADERSGKYKHIIAMKRF